MYYEVSNNKVANSRSYDPGVQVKRAKSMLELMKLKSLYDNVVLIEPIVVDVTPETMSQYGYICQSFYITDKDNQRHSFFNCDAFPHLGKLFQHGRALIYHTKRGDEVRNKILATIDSTGKEHWIR